MAGVLTLYLDPEVSYTWKESSLMVAKLQGHGPSYAEELWRWIHQFLSFRKLPKHSYKGQRSTILEDKDIALEIQLKLAEHKKDQYIWALDVVEIVATGNTRADTGSRDSAQKNIGTHSAAVVEEVSIALLTENKGNVY
jgi:hypothetical protein